MPLPHDVPPSVDAPPSAAAPPPTGFHRKLRLVADTAARTCVAALEDDFHHFEVHLRHDGQRVTAMTSRGLRTPWTTCGDAGALLRQFEGVAIGPRPLAQAAAIDAKQHCTHQFELGLAALGQATRGGERVVEIFVSDRQGDDRTTAWVRVDGVQRLSWRLHGTVIEGDGPFAGQNLRTMVAWLQQTFDDETVELAAMLRRACMVAGGRGMDLDQFDTATPVMRWLAGGCYVYQGDHHLQAHRTKGSTRKDIHGHGDLLNRPAGRG